MSRWASESSIQEAVLGVGGAAERVIADVWPACFRLAAATLGDRTLAQDAAQEICVILHRKIRSVRSPAAFDAWFYRTAMREIARIRRKYRRHDETVERFTDTADSTSLDVWNALDQLSSEMRDAVVLFYFYDLKTSDIALALNVPDTTVRTRLNRARDRLRDILKEYEPLQTRESTHA
ncbi:MAG TPA: sigma-70 family RNA polymerase sigma factor [Candidatus Baltobacteraceae bacterium]|jgi:RNA polymerase sigma-70 factor (ECF subfamily)|nr:sigma-70 family RNA polymerase sigma factor [Candidatus Baltobacteraceae bacterium]